MVKAQKFAVIGLGSFGFSMAEKLAELGAEVLAIDRSDKLVEEISNTVSASVAFDCTDENMLEAHGLANMDLAIVAIGEDFGSNVLVTKILKDMGLKVHSRATSKREARILKSVGADLIYTPEQTQGENEARRLTLQGVESYVPLSGGMVFAHVEVKKAMVGRMIRDLEIRRTYGLNIAYIGRMTEDGRKYRIPRPDDTLLEDDHLFIMGTPEDLKRYLES